MAESTRDSASTLILVSLAAILILMGIQKDARHLTLHTRTIPSCGVSPSVLESRKLFQTSRRYPKGIHRIPRIHAVDTVSPADTEASAEKKLKNGVHIYTEQDTECTLRINVTVPSGMCTQVIDRMVKKMSKNVTIPGFRPTAKKSKIPQNLIIGAIGHHHLEAACVEELIEKTVWDALKEVKDKALPKSEQIRLENRTKSVLEHAKTKSDYKYSVTVEVIPKVQWDKHYSELSVRLPVLDAEGAFLKRVNRIQKRFGAEMGVDGPFTEEDYAIVSYQFRKPADAENEPGKIIFAALGEDAPLVMHRRIDGKEVRAVKYDPNELKLMPGVREALLGMQEGEEKTIRIVIPEFWEVASEAGIEADLTVRLEEVRRHDLKPLSDSLAPWIASGTTKLDVAMQRGLEQTREELKQEEDDRLKDLITNTVAENVINKLPKRLLYQTAVSMYMDSLPKNRGTTHDIESAPTLVEKYMSQNKVRIERTARARMGLRAIADAE
eukprot:805043-Amorphochlora_amoeboformis.AAC.1